MDGLIDTPMFLGRYYDGRFSEARHFLFPKQVGEVFLKWLSPRVLDGRIVMRDRSLPISTGEDGTIKDFLRLFSSGVIFNPAIHRNNSGVLKYLSVGGINQVVVGSANTPVVPDSIYRGEYRFQFNGAFGDTSHGHQFPGEAIVLPSK